MNLKNNIMISRFHWSIEVVAITTICLIILVATTGYPVFILPSYGLGTVIIKYSMSAICVLTIIIVMAYSPRYLSIDEEKVVCKKIFGSIEIPMSTITSLNVVSNAILKGSIRNFGSGGLFGYLGRFKNRTLGNYTMYATERDSLLMIKTSDNRIFIFSCRKGAKFETFFNALNAPPEAEAVGQ